jgi:hypothetical protein
VTAGLRDIVQQHWQALERDGRASDRLRVSDLPVETADGPVVAALDGAGHRHVLLPIRSERRVRGGLDGPALVLKKVTLEDETSLRTFADLCCARPDLNDVFTGLCADVLLHVEAQPGSALKALYGQIDRWRALFRSKGSLLGIEQQAGLFGELVFLESLLEQDPGAHVLWKGPLGHRHDFASSRHAVEIKSSLATEGRRIRVHGLDQLEAPPGGLHLYWMRLEAGAGGRSLNDLAARVVDAADDENAIRSLLSTGGYQFLDAPHYEKSRFVVVEERCYAVEKGFPRLVTSELTSAGVPVTVTDVAYTVDLSSEPPHPVDAEDAQRQIVSLVREGSDAS